MPPTPTNRFNPFPGLRPFQTDEEHLFFGREGQRKELLALLREHRFLAVLGASGSGKSSLVRAGLLPALFGGGMTKAGSHWSTAVLRPGGSPFHNLATALLEGDLWADSPKPTLLELETTLSRSGLGLVEAARQARVPAGHNLLVLVDQFEELFRFSASQSESSTRDEAAAFVTLLLEAARQEPIPIYVVLTMRSDFFGDCSQFEDLAEAINRGEYLVPRLTRDQKKQAIEGPIRVGGATITPRLIQRLLGDVGDDPDQLPIMQHALMRTWDFWAANHQDQDPIDLHHYESIGGMREALSRHADEVFEALPDDRHRLVAERVFKALTERGGDNRGIRRPTRMGSLPAITAATESEVRVVIDAFRRTGCTFLMPPEPAPLEPETVIDISHESLMRAWVRLRRWVEEEAQSARIYSRLAETAALQAEGKAGLYHDPDLQIALSWREASHPTPAWASRYHPGFAVAMEFLDRSAATSRAEEEAREAARQRELEQARALAETERRRAEEQVRFSARLKWMVRGLGLVAMVALAAFGFALIARQEARRQAQIAESNRETAERLGTESKRLADDRKSTLTRADYLAASDQLEQRKVKRALTSLARSLRTDPSFTPAAARTVQVLTEENLQLEPPLYLQQDKPIQWWSLSNTKDIIWTVDFENRGFLWEVATGRRIAPLAEGKQVQRVHFTRDGKLVFTGIPEDGTLRGWDAKTGAAATPAMNPGYGFGDYFVSPATGGVYRLVIQNGDGSIQIWDSATGQPVSPRLKTEGKVARFGFTRDGSLVYGDFDDRTLGLWKAASGEPVIPPIRHGLAVNEVVSSPDSRFLVITTSGERMLQWWDVTAPATAPRNVRLDLPIRMVRFHRDSERLLVVTTADGQGDVEARLPVIDLKTGATLAEAREPKLSTSPGVQLPNVDPIGGWLEGWFAGGVSEQRSFKAWDLNRGNTFQDLPRQESRILQTEFSPDGGRLFLSLENKQGRIWDLFAGRPLGEPIEIQQQIRSIFFTPEGERLGITTLEADTDFKLYDARTGRLLFEPIQIPDLFVEKPETIREPGRVAAFGHMSVRLGDQRTTPTRGVVVLLKLESRAASQKPILNAGNISQVRYSPDGRWFLAINQTSGAPEVRIYEAESRKLIHRLRHPAVPFWGTFSPDGKRVATGGSDRTARVWDVGSGQLIQKFPAKSYVYSLAFSPDGSRLLVHSDEGFIQVWDLNRGQPLFEPLKLAEDCDNAVFSPDGSLFVVSPLDKAARVFVTDTGKEAMPPLAMEEFCSEVAISPDGEAIFASSFGGKIQVWNARTGERIKQMPDAAYWIKMAVHPNSRLLASAAGGLPTETGSVSLWKWEEEKLAQEPMPIPGQAGWLEFSRDGSLLVAASNAGELRVWDVETGRTLLARSYPRTPNGIWTSMSVRPNAPQVLVGTRGQLLDVVELPRVPDQAPEWLPQLAEAVAGARLSAQGVTESIGPDMLAGLRKASAPAAQEPLDRWREWFQSDWTNRSASPNSKLTVSEFALDLAQDPSPLTNRFRALLLAPNLGSVYARLAFDLSSSTSRTNVPPQGTNQWNSMVDWYSIQATNLAPQSAEVWALRAGTLCALGRFEEAGAAANRAMSLDDQNPNSWYAKALVQAASGAVDQSQNSFDKAVELLPSSNSPLEWQNQRVKPFLAGVLREIPELDPRNAVELARLGRRRLDNSDDTTTRKEWEARWLTRQATGLAPTNPEVWRLRAEVLLDSKEADQAFAALEKAIDHDDRGQPAWNQLGVFLRTRAFLLEKAGRDQEARTLMLSRGIPPRPADATPLQVDLSKHYTLSLLESIHRAKGRWDEASGRFNKLPTGLTTLAGVPFDVRGAIQLSGAAMAAGEGSFGVGSWVVPPPRSVEGIPVNQKALWLHFLHGAGWAGVKPGTIIGRYRIHYADGQTHDFPIRVGGDVMEWRRNAAATTTASRLAWLERSGELYKMFFASTWENPRPEATIERLDLISDMTTAAPFVIAVSLEQPRSDAGLDQLEPAAVVREAVEKLTRPQGIGTAGRSYAEKLSATALRKAPNDPIVKVCRAEVLVRTGAPANQAEELLTGNPRESESWHVRALLAAREGRLEETLEATRKALAGVPFSAESDARRAAYIRTAVEALEKAAKLAEARRFTVQARIPPRHPNAPAGLLDLGSHYNGALTEAWYQRANDYVYSPVLQTFPAGTVTLAGIPFDARGILQLNDRSRNLVHQFPNEVNGIQVGLKGDRLHFVHGTSFDERFGTVVLRYRIHYANGEQREAPAAAGQDIHGFYIARNATPPANTVWHAPNVTVDFDDAGLFMSTWENPLPEVEIRSIDVISALTIAQPFVVAITVEQFRSDAELEKMPPREIAELAFHRTNPVSKPSARTLDYARRASAKALELGANDPQVRRWRAETMRRLGDLEGALQEIEKSLELEPGIADVWRHKGELLAALRRYDEVPNARLGLRRAELKERIPPRTTDTPETQIDLTAYYNASLTERIHALAGAPPRTFSHLSGLPQGVQRFAGIGFDTRGLVHLTSANLDLGITTFTYPREVTGIPIGRHARRIHFLQGTGWVRKDPDGTVIGNYVFHFANGEKREVPVILGTDLYDWVLADDRRNQPSGRESKLAWSGPNPISEDTRLGLYVKTWENPLPEVEITQMDFVSAMKEATPFLVALTVE